MDSLPQEPPGKPAISLLIKKQEGFLEEAGQKLGLEWGRRFLHHKQENAFVQ